MPGMDGDQIYIYFISYLIEYIISYVNVHVYCHHTSSQSNIKHYCCQKESSPEPLALRQILRAAQNDCG